MTNLFFKSCEKMKTDKFTYSDIIVISFRRKLRVNFVLKMHITSVVFKEI